MSRPTGSKNKIPSKKDLVKQSIQSISLIVGYINKHIDFPTLSLQQQTELSITALTKQSNQDAAA